MKRNSTANKVGAKEVFNANELYVGIDVHKRSYHVAFANDRGQVYSLVTSSDNIKVANMIHSHGDTIQVVAYEAGPTGFSLARELESRDIPVIVVPPSRVDRPVTRTAKTDSLDCRKLALMAKAGSLYSIAIPTVEEQEHRGLYRRRNQVADDLRRSKLRIKSFLLFEGISEPHGLSKWTRTAVAALKVMELNKTNRVILDSFLRHLEFARQELRTLEKQLEAMMKEKLAVKYECLRSMPGVGPIVASGFLLEIFQPERFERSDDLASYLGLAPIVRQSGEKQGEGRIVKAGKGILRSQLIQAAWVWRGRDSGASALYNKIVAKTGKAQKAIVAVARKLAIILWRLSIENRLYSPVKP